MQEKSVQHACIRFCIAELEKYIKSVPAPARKTAKYGEAKKALAQLTRLTDIVARSAQKTAKLIRGPKPILK